MKQLSLLYTVSVLALAQQPAAQQSAAQPPPPKIRHIIGLDNVKQNAKGQLTIQNGTMQFKAGKEEASVPTSSITDVFVGNETTQAGGTAGKVVKTAAIAAPFGSGKALTLLFRTKVDVLTVVYRGSEGGVHGAILALPKGLAEPTRAQLVAAGAHASASSPELKERPKP